ncbi:MurR/RpiR family transcriptional regulator [Marinovum sp.]|uniref:MurR/RpiR family transcriptional regulator n=1 Tax=Marinovum sp. TaxID=2024839 RepID=UPI003A8F1E43
MTKLAEMQTAPESVSELLERLDAQREDLPKRLRQCADFTRRHLHLIAVSTVSEMAQAADVAPSVYMRFCQAVGFTGYSQMQNLLRARFTDFRPDYDARLASLSEGGALGTGRLLADFVEAGHKSLLTLSNTVTSDRLDRIARGMSEARVIHLVGLRRAFAVVSNMGYLFEKMGVPANVHFTSGMIESHGAVLPGDVLFAISFAPFSEETLRLAQSAADRGITVFGLTDSQSCPLSQSASELLLVREGEVAGFRGLSAANTLTTALAVSVSALRHQS